MSDDSDAASEHVSIERTRPDEISADVTDPVERVPDIGSGWRWYDLPFRFLRWILEGKPKKVLPWRARILVTRAINFFIPFHMYDRAKVKSPDHLHHDLVVPGGEGVSQGGLWIVELFPPSHYKQLVRDLRRNGWESPHNVAMGGPLADQVTRARAGQGFLWSRIGRVAGPHSNQVFGAKLESLPSEFDLIELSAVQLGTSITAVVAFVQFSEIGQRSLNRVWNANHEPVFKWQGWHRPLVRNRYFASIDAVQAERQRIHDAARHWLADRCHGFFAASLRSHPVLDMNLFDQFDPSTQRPPQSLGAPLRALGMSFDGDYTYKSPQIPGAVLTPARSIGSINDKPKNCWGIAGAHDRVVEANDQHQPGEGSPSVSAIAAMFDDAARAFLLHIAVIAYARELRARMSQARDLAQSRHGKFSPRTLRGLREEVLHTSLDLTSVARDSAELWSEDWRRWDGVEVQCVPAPGTSPPQLEEFDFIDSLGKRRTVAFEELLSDDETYRTLLSTVASLGSSADASKTGRMALVVAGASLMVATVTLLVTEAGTHSLWSALLKLIG